MWNCSCGIVIAAVVVIVVMALVVVVVVVVVVGLYIHTNGLYFSYSIAQPYISFSLANDVVRSDGRRSLPPRGLIGWTIESCGAE